MTWATPVGVVRARMHRAGAAPALRRTLVWQLGLGLAGLGCGGGADTQPNGSAENAEGAASAPPLPVLPMPEPGPAGPEMTAAAPAFPQAQPRTSALETRLARLTHTQYLRTVQDLLGTGEPLDLSFAPDALNGFAFDTSADFRVDARLGPQYRAMAERLAERVVTDDALLARLVGCDAAAPG
ncbi:MAG TPA: DUF1587 domain-containing protein, partial [Polyangiaceae bacterium]|nr:DUF1587 domain-containing protein [Polyangiaceae bacterium]